MNVKEAIAKRRSLRSLAPVDVTEELVKELAESVKMAPSCFNNQPWKFIFVYDKKLLQSLLTALSKGNEWAGKSSMIIAITGKKEDDCVIRDREYYLFDIGLATGQMLLRATELNLVAHPIAGYSPSSVRKILNIDKNLDVIALIVIGKFDDIIDPELSAQQQETEKKRPPRKPDNENFFHNLYQPDH